MATKTKTRREEVFERLSFAESHAPQKVFEFLGTSEEGLTEEQVEESREKYCDNVITHGKQESLFKRIFNAFVNPFTAILFALAIVSTFTEIVWAAPGEKSPMTVIIITVMVLISGILRFVQETRSGNAAAKLLQMIKTTTCVERKENGKQEILLDEVVVGDIVYLLAGDIIPADVKIISAKDLFVSQSALTGESEPVEKYAQSTEQKNKVITESPNLAFMGSNVVSGSAVAVVIATGNDTMFGQIAKAISGKPPKTSFEKGVNSVSWILIRFMLIMVPIVLFVNGFTKGNWMEAALFAISIAVGLTPEMLPMIVTTSLAKGAVSMSQKDVIIKNLNSIQNLGAIDILCTDKTGTLTQDKVVLEYHMDLHGNEDPRVLRYAFLNSYYQTGLKNLLDLAIIESTEEETQENSLKDFISQYQKVDEIPFDFERRRMSVVVSDLEGHTELITKGAAEEMLSISSRVELGGQVMELTDEIRDAILTKVHEFNQDGLRVLAVAQKENPAPAGAFSVSDESEMTLIGYLAFLDPPKETAAAAVNALKENGVDVKILTGDNERVTTCVCKQVGIKIKRLMLGGEIEKLSDEELLPLVEETTVFAKLSPMQKSRVVRLLRESGHAVGYMGDGINDTSAMKESDVGISVDTAVDIAKETADVILLQKDLMVLEHGIIEGRKTYANMIKYIKMTASSNFGNMLSVVIASAFLPFLPMASLHLILLNMIYDISCTAIPWDNVDVEFLHRPKNWDALSVTKFMLWIGPVSSIFDIITYALMYFVICPIVCGGLHFHQLHTPAQQALFISVFQAGWFVESMWSQTLVIHMIRTRKIPFIQSHASFSVTALTVAGIILLTTIPFTPIGTAIGLHALPAVYFAYLAAIVVLYMILATVVKKIYVRKYGQLL